MKLIIQIPCLNEEETLPITLKDIPREIPGVDEVEILVIDDGSTDRTSEVAKKLGVDHIIRFTERKGLAVAFMTGLDAALKLGADIIVNTDADNQYYGGDIPNLIKPILEGKADIVVGDRNVESIPYFSFIKKKLQKLGSWVVRQLSGTKIPDATSGFRAYNREAALRINIISQFTYTLETIIQAGKKNISITHIPVRTNEKLRESRLYTSTWNYIKKSASTILRVYAMYEPLKVFSIIGGILFLAGLAISVRFLYYYFTGNGAGHIQSLISAAILLVIGFQIGLIGLVSDLIFANRKLIEDLLYRVRGLELLLNKEPEIHYHNKKREKTNR